jgi:DNA-binding XRE family transcriptional regulator
MSNSMTAGLTKSAQVSDLLGRPVKITGISQDDDRCPAVMLQHGGIGVAFTAYGARALAARLIEQADVADPNPVEWQKGSRVGDTVRTMREASGVSRRALAARVGVSASTLARIEAGKVEVRRYTADAITKALAFPDRPDLAADPAVSARLIPA